MMLSTTMARCYAKPRGFPEDHETVTAIYRSEPEGDARLGPIIDRWFSIIRFAARAASWSETGFLIGYAMDLV
jgi:hypothetical protein